MAKARKRPILQYKMDIENHAKGKGIEIEWRTSSYFESPFVCEQNSSIAQHFFSLKKGILDSIAELITVYRVRFKTDPFGNIV